MKHKYALLNFFLTMSESGRKNLRNEIRGAGLTMEQVADVLGISTPTLYNRMNKGDDDDVRNIRAAITKHKADANPQPQVGNQIPVSGSIDATDLFNELKRVTNLLLEAKDQLFKEVVRAKEQVIDGKGEIVEAKEEVKEVQKVLLKVGLNEKDQHLKEVITLYSERQKGAG